MIRPLALTLSLAITCLSCYEGKNQPESALTADHSAIADPQKRWQAYGVQDYSLLQTRTCFCDNGGKAFLVTVRQGSIANVVDPANGGNVPPEKWGEFKTVQGLFDLLKSVDSTKVATVSASYDTLYGYPRIILLDSSAVRSGDEFGFSTEIVKY